MIKKLEQRPWFTSLILSAYFLTYSLPARAIDELSILEGAKGDASRVDREYFSTNKENRFLIRVQVWGDVPLSGIHHVPDNTTLMDAVGFAGGPTGFLSESSISLIRAAPPQQTDLYPQNLKLGGKELVTSTTYRNLVLQNNDVIYMESPPKADTFSKNLAIIATILGIVSAGATVYLVTKK